MEQEPRQINFAFIGFGHVGRSFARLLIDRRKWLLKEFGIEWKLTGIATQNHGTAIDREGLPIRKILGSWLASLTTMVCRPLGWLSAPNVPATPAPLELGVAAFTPGDPMPLLFRQTQRQFLGGYRLPCRIAADQLWRAILLPAWSCSLLPCRLPCRMASGLARAGARPCGAGRVLCARSAGGRPLRAAGVDHAAALPDDPPVTTFVTGASPSPRTPLPGGRHQTFKRSSMARRWPTISCGSA